MLRQGAWKAHEDNDCGPWTEGSQEGGLWTSSPGDPAGACGACAAHLAARSGRRPRLPPQVLLQASRPSSARDQPREPGGTALGFGFSMADRNTCLPLPGAVPHVSEIIKVNVCENSYVLCTYEALKSLFL